MMGSPAVVSESLAELSAAVVSRVEKSLSQSVQRAFSRLTTNRQRALFVVEHRFDHFLPDVHADYSGKCDASADRLRLAGNVHFRRREFAAALRCYSESVRVAPACEAGDCRQLALALANRSAALYEVRRYSECAADIGRCLRRGYPVPLRCKLYARLARCHAALGQARGVRRASDAAAQAAPATARRELVGALECDCAKLVVKRQRAERHRGDRRRDPLTTRTADVFETKYDDVVGRYVTAGRDVSAGDVLLVEAPYASVVYSQCALTHCNACSRWVRLASPCDTCSAVVYCDAACRSRAWAAHHAAECRYGRLLAAPWLGRLGHLAFRLALVAGRHQVLVGTSAAYSAGYSAVRRLQTHEASPGSITLAVMAAWLAHILQHVGFAASDNRALVSSLLLHMQVVSYNAYSVTDAGGGRRPLAVGMALYRALSLANHSCEPAADVVFSGHLAVVFALRGVTAGGELSVDYGVVFYLNERDARRATLLEHYRFICRCRVSDNYGSAQTSQIKRDKNRCFIRLIRRPSPCSLLQT